MINKRLLLLSFVLLSYSYHLNAQSRLVLHSESIDSLFSWLDRGCLADEVPSLIDLPANQIMEQLWIKNENDTIFFSDVLSHFNPKDTLPDDYYLLNEAYKKKEQISLLKKRIFDSILDDAILKHVTNYLPVGYNPSQAYDIYLTATGWKWGDAMTFNYTKKNNKYIISENGTPAIIFNLSIIASTYGKTVEEQILTFKKVLAHELFHAFLYEYIKDKEYYAPAQIESKALFMLMNEGIAHFIADKDYIETNYTALREREKASFSQFSDKLIFLFDEKKDEQLRTEALEEGLYGSYWDKYICTTGLFMAYHIYQSGGYELLRKCIEKGPGFFIKAYMEICKTNNKLLLFPDINTLFSGLPHE